MPPKGSGKAKAKAKAAAGQTSLTVKAAPAGTAEASAAGVAGVAAGREDELVLKYLKANRPQEYSELLREAVRQLQAEEQPKPAPREEGQGAAGRPGALGREVPLLAALGASPTRPPQPAPAPAAEREGGDAEVVVEQPQKKQRTRQGAEEAKAAATMTSAEWKALQNGMAEKWPQPAYMAEPHPEGRGHTAFRDQTYEVITRWTAETKISYRPHAKAPGSKSHVRYEKYSAAKTAAEALELGSWPIDWCWDYERGYLKVEGPLRDEPIDITQVPDLSVLTEVDRVIARWYLRELAKNLKLDIKELSAGKLQCESLQMRAHRMVAQREAKQRLADAEKHGRKISEEDVFTVLKSWGFGRNITRQNVMPDDRSFVWSDTIGLLRDRIGDIHVTHSTKAYPEVLMIFNKYLTDRLPADVASFTWTSLNVNKNYAAKLHRDGNNFGPSFLKAFGTFTGGELGYWPEDDRQKDKMEELRQEDKVEIDVKNNLLLFNGNCGHCVSDFQGERYSLVYFTVSCFDKAPEECKQQLRDMGTRYPTADEDRYALLRAPRGYSIEGTVAGEGGAASKDAGGDAARAAGAAVPAPDLPYRVWRTAELDEASPTAPPPQAQLPSAPQCIAAAQLPLPAAAAAEAAPLPTLEASLSAPPPQAQLPAAPQDVAAAPPAPPPNDIALAAPPPAPEANPTTAPLAPLPSTPHGAVAAKPAPPADTAAAAVPPLGLEEAGPAAPPPPAQLPLAPLDVSAAPAPPPAADAGAVAAAPPPEAEAGPATPPPPGHLPPAPQGAAAAPVPSANTAAAAAAAAPAPEPEAGPPTTTEPAQLPSAVQDVAAAPVPPLAAATAASAASPPEPEATNGPQADTPAKAAPPGCGPTPDKAENPAKRKRDEADAEDEGSKRAAVAAGA